MAISSPEILIQLELIAAQKNCLKGIIIQPSLSSQFQWQVFLMPQSGVFKRNILTFLVDFDKFPQKVPHVIFQSGLFHPLIDPTNSLFDTSDFAIEWNQKNHVYSLLNYIYESFVKIPILDRKNIPNAEAAKLLKEDLGKYTMKAISNLITPNPSEQTQINEPKFWNSSKEKLSFLL